MDGPQVLIVGAGFAGMTLAERLTSELGIRCLMVDRRDHIGGNSQDAYDEHGVLIHKYGPHYFRTNAPRIRQYLSRFTEWREVEYKIKSFSEGRFWNFPINLNTFEQFIGRESSSEEMIEWLDSHKVAIENPSNSEEVIISQVGWDFYNMFFKGYTLKQWKRHPRDLDASVCGRIPIRTNRDDRYLREEFQALPRDGYHRLFDRMVETCGNLLEIRLDTDYRKLGSLDSFCHMVYTGPIDEYFDFQHGRLPYRSLRFEHEHYNRDQLKERVEISGEPGFWQPAMQVNYPNENDYTRIVEIKHATGQPIDGTTIVKEYPEDYGPGKEPYYPIPAPDAKEIYGRYKDLADREDGVSFVGRLATYRYYNMDQVVGSALTEFEKIKARLEAVGVGGQNG